MRAIQHWISSKIDGAYDSSDVNTLGERKGQIVMGMVPARILRRKVRDAAWVNKPGTNGKTKVPRTKVPREVKELRINVVCDLNTDAQKYVGTP